MVYKTNFSNSERKYLDGFNRHGFFDSKELNEYFIELSKEFFPLSKSFIGGYTDRKVSNDMSLFIGNMSRDAMIMLFDDSTFSCDEGKTPDSISFSGKSLSKILEDLNNYSIINNKNLRQGIYYFNHKTATESRISFIPELEIVVSDANILSQERKVQSYIIACENPLEKTIELLRDTKFNLSLLLSNNSS